MKNQIEVNKGIGAGYLRLASPIFDSGQMRSEHIHNLFDLRIEEAFHDGPITT